MIIVAYNFVNVKHYVTDIKPAREGLLSNVLSYKQVTKKFLFNIIVIIYKVVVY